MTRSASESQVHAAANSGSADLSLKDDATLWDLEQKFWTSGADSARATSVKNAIMVFPYPAGILQGDRVWNDLRPRTGWRSVEMTDRSVTRRGALAVLAYHVSAEKTDVSIYEALCSSSYLHDAGKWLRLSHQQTPWP